MQSIAIKTVLIPSLLVFAVGLGIAYGTSAEISRDIPAITVINVISLADLADIDGDGKVDRRDLMAIATKLNTRPAEDAREDINHDGAIDVSDLAIVARYFKREAQV